MIVGRRPRGPRTGDRRPCGSLRGGAEPAFGSVEEARDILGTIMGRHNETVCVLNAASEEFDTAHLR